MIHVIATIELLEGQRDAFLNEFQKLIPEVQSEAGCIEYGATIDVETNIAAQPEPRTNVVIIVEKWDSLAGPRSSSCCPSHAGLSPTSQSDDSIGQTPDPSTRLIERSASVPQQPAKHRTSLTCTRHRIIPVKNLQNLAFAVCKDPLPSFRTLSEKPFCA